jgi:uncharacterized protein YhjY with autotransporter beta-barrel domain
MSSSLLRRALLGSAALCGLFAAGAASAQTGVGTGTGPTTLAWNPELAPQIVIANPGTSTTARDSGVTGVGQMVIDQQNGFLGLCTGSLINPRTVLFAAHCVNTVAATTYGANSGGRPISFGFQADNLPGLVQWFNATVGGQPNLLRHQSNPAFHLYNVNQVRYHPLSLEPAANRFLYGDVATATLDTPAANVPLWSVLFSPLTPTAPSAAGTGYGVNVIGYGSHGSAATGSASGSDFRRRIADNIVGALTDLQTFEQFLFGGAPSGLTQNLYFIDFDDPLRGQPGASPFDFNAFRDNAAGPREGTTAQGDSGGPLALKNAQNLRLAIGVLSGGYTRFFNGQPANGYGTVSFYQPLYLYWDWIAANNPYRYVTNQAGDRLWSDAGHWVTTLDPNYMIIGPNGTFINGIPAAPGQEVNGRSGQFGEICFQNATLSQCLNTATGGFEVVNRPIGTDGVGEASHGAAEMRAPFATTDGGGAGPAVQVAEAEAEVGPASLPAPTLANGLPGATNFVPNNQDPNRLTGAIGRYFDVALNAAGRTTLNTAVTIDRFRVTGANARLNVAAGGSLTSLMDITQMTGGVHVDGAVRSMGDYLLLSGLLSGRGQVTAPFVTNVMGGIAPGDLGVLGTLTLNTNLVLSSGSSLLIDVGPAGADRLVVAAGPGSQGTALLGGRLALSAAGLPTYGASYNILRASGGVSGQFDTVAADLTPMLFGVVSYTASDVNVRIDARSFRSVVNPDGAAEMAMAGLLDQNRATSYAALSALYQGLDVASMDQLEGALTALTPRTETARLGQAAAMTDALFGFTADRLGLLAEGEAGGALTVAGNPVAMAFGALTLPDGMVTHVQTADGAVRRDVLPDHVSAYVHAGYLDGAVRGFGGASDSVDGWFAAAGVEFSDADAALGFGLQFADTESMPTALQSSQAQLVQLAVYGSRALSDGWVGTATLQAGRLETDSERVVIAGPNTFTLSADEAATTFGAEVGVGKRFARDGYRLRPRASLRYAQADFGDYTETGGAAALAIDGAAYESLQARFGLDLDSPRTTASGLKVTPRVSASLVHDLLDGPEAISVGFAGGQGAPAVLALEGRERAWVEVGAGLAIAGERLTVDLSIDSNIGRDDVDYDSFRAAVRWAF